jgi:parallel beta-helix repeat protein/predicted outer membrane repeat protein
MKLKRVLTCLTGLMLVISPIRVYAEENSFVAQSSDGNDLYTDIDSAWQAATSGTTIELMSDWELNGPLIVNEGETVTIEMNGYKMVRNLDETSKDGEVICINKNATLNMNGNNAPDTCFTFSGYNENNEFESSSLKSGGLISGGYSYDGGGIYMNESSHLNLNNVAIVGNTSRKNLGGGDGGGIYMNGKDSTVTLANVQITQNRANINGGGIFVNNDDCTVNMYDSIVSNNQAKNGGGIYVDGSNVIVNMENSSINDNSANESGGGIYSNKDATYVCMNKNSKVSNNYAKKYGGGIYFDNPYCQITSGDGLAEVSNNSCGDNGGGVEFEGSIRGNTALVKNITFSSNSADGYGGAINLDQSGVTLENCNFDQNSAIIGGGVHIYSENTYFTNCTFEDNTATNKGGAIYIYGSYNAIDGCTIINNHAEVEGGGIYQYEKDDITLSGVVTIKNNTRGGGYADDLMLQKNGLYTAYVKGEVKAGSSVGIRTGDTGETKIGIDITSDCSQYFFLNDDGNYHISYEDGTLHKRSGSLVGSIFGNNNLGTAVLMMVGIIVVGVVCLVVHNKKNREEA